jgi:hypothetical protein
MKSESGSLKSGNVCAEVFVSTQHLSIDATGKFPEYPDDEVGGSAAIFKKQEPGDAEKMEASNSCN